MKNFLAFLLCLALFGCAHTSMIKPFVEPQYGMTKQQLVGLIGDPESKQLYQKPDKSKIEFYIYVRKYQGSQEKVPVGLIDNKVVGWGKTFFEDHVDMDDIRLK